MNEHGCVVDEDRPRPLSPLTKENEDDAVLDTEGITELVMPSMVL
jgi:hypothetical protein